jgi:hypothetical protein
MLSTRTFSDYIRRLHTERADGIAAYWLEETGSRSELAHALSQDLSDLAVMPATVRGGDFDDANGIIDDLARTIAGNRSWFTEQMRSAVIRDQKFSLVLISKAPLGVPQLSSPVALPDWFPAWPERLITVKIISVSHSIDLSLASSDIPISLINSALLELEQALCGRLNAVLSRDPGKLVRLFGRAGGSGGALDPTKLIPRASTEAGARSADDFRPGGGADSPHMVSMLFRLWWDCSPGNLHDLAKLLAEALDIADDTPFPVQYSLGSLLTRTTKPPPSKTPPGVMFARNALVNLSHAIQFTNAAHHAGDYPSFPAMLTIAYARDIARSCKAAADCLLSLQ